MSDMPRFSSASAMLLALCTSLTGCNQSSDTTAWQGYVEGDYLYLTAGITAQLDTLAVTRGQHVTVGDPLFSQEATLQRAAVTAAADQSAAAQAQVADLQQGKRAEELQVIKAQLAQARASAQLAQTELKRIEKLVNSQFVSDDKLDTARSNARLSAARVTELQAQLQVAELGGRSNAIAAAQAQQHASEASLTQAQWQLEQSSRISPANGVIDDVYFQTGEFLQTGSVVLSLLPDDQRKVRFFIPEPQLGGVTVGDTVQVHCDSCGDAMTMTVSWIAANTEFTPPVIYSQQTRSALVTMAEATPSPDDVTRLKPGQPVDVVPANGD